jgi:uncharacterized membrane protein
MATLTQSQQAQRAEPRERGRGARGTGAVLGMNAEKVARGLGWFSIGLGAAELLAPKAVARIAGSRNNSTLLRGFGLREIAAGIGILMRPRQAAWVWARVAGDAIDLSYLGAQFWDAKSDKGKAVGATAMVAGVTALDVLCAQSLRGAPLPFLSAAPVRAAASIVVNRSPEECYGFWRKYENLPRFMSHVRAVRAVAEKRTYWSAETPGGISVEWYAETMDDVTNQRISWRSIPGSDIFTSGEVRFERAPGDRGCIVREQMEYSFPGGSAGSALAKLIGKEPGQLLDKDLRRFKQIIETGNIVTTEGQPSGRTRGKTWLDSMASE